MKLPTSRILYFSLCFFFVWSLGWISLGCTGNSFLISLSGSHSIPGSAVVVHADSDDLGKGKHLTSLLEDRYFFQDIRPV